MNVTRFMRLGRFAEPIEWAVKVEAQAMGKSWVLGFALLLAGAPVTQADSGSVDSRPADSGLNSRPAQVERSSPLEQAPREPRNPPSTRPTPVSASDRRAVRNVVEAQLKALTEEDAERAFSFASPGIREQVGDAASFMTMVRSAYPMLIHPEAVSFFQPEGSGKLIAQVVQFRDHEGKLWRAVYELERQADRHWRINGCIVLPDRPQTIT